MIFECPICGHILDCSNNLIGAHISKTDGDLRAWCFGPEAIDLWTGPDYKYWADNLDKYKKYYSGKDYHEPFEMVRK